MTPSRDTSDSPAGFRFAVISSLIRHEGYSVDRAEDLLLIWQRYARYALLSGKTPESTAAHLARFARYQGPTASRDAHGRSEEIHPAIADEAIAEDLRQHADAVTDPVHARELYDVSDWIEFSPLARTRDPAQVAAHALLQTRVHQKAALRTHATHGNEIASLIFPSDFTERDIRQWTQSHGFACRTLDYSPSTGSLRVPQRAMSDFERDSLRTILLSEGENIRAVVGRPRAGVSKPRPVGTRKGRSTPQRKTISR